MQRNDLIFINIQPSPTSCLNFFKQEFALVILREKAKYKERMSLWLEALL